MDTQIQDWIRWGAGLVVAAYARYVHNQIRQEHVERIESIKELNDRINAVEIQSATLVRDSEYVFTAANHFPLRDTLTSALIQSPVCPCSHAISSSRLMDRRAFT